MRIASFLQMSANHQVEAVNRQIKLSSNTGVT